MHWRREALVITRDDADFIKHVDWHVVGAFLCTVSAALLAMVAEKTAKATNSNLPRTVGAAGVVVLSSAATLNALMAVEDSVHHGSESDTPPGVIVEAFSPLAQTEVVD